MSNNPGTLNNVPTQGHRRVMQTFQVETEINTTVTPNGQPQDVLAFQQQNNYAQPMFAQQPVVAPQTQYVPVLGPNGQVVQYVPAPTSPVVTQAAPAVAAPAAAVVTPPPAAAAAVTPPVTPPQTWWQKHWKKVLWGAIAFLALLFLIPLFVKGYSNFYRTMVENQQVQDANNNANAALEATMQSMQFLATQTALNAQQQQPLVIPQQANDPNVGGGTQATPIPSAAEVFASACQTRLGERGAPADKIDAFCNTPAFGDGVVGPLPSGTVIPLGTITFDAEWRVWALTNFTVPANASYAYNYIGAPQKLLEAPFFVGTELGYAPGDPNSRIPFTICWDTITPGCEPPVDLFPNQ